MLFVVFFWYLPYFSPKSEFKKFIILIFLIMARPKKLALAPRATIGDNTVCPFRIGDRQPQHVLRIPSGNLALIAFTESNEKCDRFHLAL